MISAFKKLGIRRNKILLLNLYFFVWLISCLEPVYPTQMFLQHSVTLIVLIGLMIVMRKNSLSDRSFTFVVFFMILHIIGARWIYSYVPYDEFFKWITGVTITELFGFTRNHYDRFVHLMFGIMMIPPFKEIYIKWFRCPVRLAGLMAILTILSLSMIYEVFEWGLTLVLSPEDAENYNGQQGDLWDSQEDMALAMLGAVISLIIGSLTGLNRKQNDKKDVS
jgi:putative membrane protein